MLSKETLSTENSIEVHFCKEFELLERHLMSNELAEIFMSITFANMSDHESFEEHLASQLKGKFPYEVLCKRLEHVFTYTLDESTKYFLVCLTEGNPGKIVMYLTYLQYISKKIKMPIITFDIFGEKIFPNGFPSEEDLSKLWNNTKVNADNMTVNLIDYKSALVSIL